MFSVSTSDIERYYLASGQYHNAILAKRYIDQEILLKFSSGLLLIT